MILFGVWAPSEKVFWDTWIAAGICSAPGEYTQNYAGMIETTTSWSGKVKDLEGNVVPGWHTNVKIVGDLEYSFTVGLPQTNTDGSLKSIWERTRALTAFGLVYKPADPVTGFPKGYQSATGVVYADFNDFTSPSNVWA